MARAKKAKPLTHAELLTRLHVRYAPPEWVLLEEFEAPCASRRADLVGISTYPSRGVRLVGWELKSSRADVIKELKDPDKAQAMQRYCDLWYLVVGRKDLIGTDELPPKWGLIVPHGTGLRRASKAEKLEPEAWPRTLIAKLMRKAYGNSIEEEEKRKIRQEAWNSAKEHMEIYAKTDQNRLKALEAAIDLFYKETGIYISKYGGNAGDRVREQGRRFKLLSELRFDTAIERADTLAGNLNKIVEQLRETVTKARANGKPDS